MIRRETIVVLGVLAGLIGATVLPFAVPAMQLGDAGSTPTPGEDKPAPAGDAFTPAETTHTTAAEPASVRSAPNSRSGQTALPTPDVQCDVSPHRGLPDEFPLTVRDERVTGEGVSVAVIDPSGFDVDDPRIAGRVAATKSFWSRGTADITNGGDNRHGTASAATVARLAPDASLYLANFQKAVDFTAAIDWAIRQEVDVIVAPATFYAKPNDGSAPVSRAVSKAVETGIPVVVPTGNAATQHWEGTYQGGPWLEFAPNDTRLYLRGGEQPVRAWLWWNRTNRTAPNEFRVVLYEDLGERSRRIATSRDYPKGPVSTNQVLFERVRSNNFLSSTIGNGTYYLRVEGPEGDVRRVELTTVAHPLERPVPRGSVMAPATANGSIIAVGAARDSTGRALTTSSRGPTNDGRPGVDILAPGAVTVNSGATFTGTSAATAYAGGIVALMTEQNRSLTPRRAEAVLQGTAGPATPTDANLSTGYGLIDPVDALHCLARG